MLLKTFKWKVLIDSSGGVDFRTREVEFGDGYEQVVGDGINTKKVSHSLKLIGKIGEMKEVATFLEEHAGYKPFIFKHPFMGEGVYRCLKYSFDPVAKDIYKISFSVKQAYM